MHDVVLLQEVEDTFEEGERSLFYFKPNSAVRRACMYISQTVRPSLWRRMWCASLLTRRVGWGVVVVRHADIRLHPCRLPFPHSFSTG